MDTMGLVQDLALKALMAFASGQLKQIPMQELNQFMQRYGQAFGPAGLRHFSTLNAREAKALLIKVPVLSKKHEDWPKAFQWVPRTLTTWVGPAPTLDDIIDGNVSDTKPIPAAGEWFVMRGGMAMTTEFGIHTRLGWRWDDVDKYWTLSFALKDVSKLPATA